MAQRHSRATEAPGGSHTQRISNLVASFGLGYLLCIALVVVPILMAGIWTVVANTRFLDLLMSSGIVAYTDMDFGFIRGIPNLTDYLKSQDSVDERLVLICFAVYLGFYLTKAVQFHSLAHLYKLKGSFAQHTSAFFYGLGLNRMLPYNAGDVATVAALEAQGESRQRVASVLHVMDVFVCFEVLVFFTIGLLLTGWRSAFSQALPALVFFAALYYITKSTRSPRRIGVGDNGQRFTTLILRALANDPWTLAKLAVLSLLAFFLDDITPFITSQAFTSQYVHLNVPFLVIQAGVVSGYIASRVPITPGCIGQYEFGFATALVLGGSALPEAITIALLDGLIRHTVALTLYVVVKLKNGVAVDLRTVLTTFMGLAPEPATDSR